MKTTAALLLLIFYLFPQYYCCAQTQRQVILYNWKDYTNRDILNDFESEFGIKVILKEYETKDMMLSEAQSAPGDFDVIVASDSTVYSLSQYRLIRELDLTKIPNHKFIKEKFKRLPVDPENRYSLAYLWGASGLVLNTDFVPADTDSYASLWDEKNKGKIALMDDFREAIAAVLKYSRVSLNTGDAGELGAAKNNAVLLKENDVKLGDTLGNLEKVMSGELWIAQVYSGDVIYKAKDRGNIKFILPAEGFPVFVDNLVISIDSAHPEEAHQLINFFLQPENAARQTTVFCNPTTVAAEPFLAKEILDNPYIYPSEEAFRRGEFFGDVGGGGNRVRGDI